MAKQILLHKMNILRLVFIVFLLSQVVFSQTSPANSPAPPSHNEYIWFEAEDTRGFSTQPAGAPVLNPSWMNLTKDKAPGWGMNGTGTSAEWSQGGASEWNSASASADETRAIIYQDVEIPRGGEYKFWVRYADYAGKSENFVVRITQANKEVFRHEFGVKDVVDPHDELSMYWEWSFIWDQAKTKLEKGPARISFEIEKAAEARRHIDCVLLTNDLAYVAEGRRKPDFAAARYLREWSSNRETLAPLTSAPPRSDVPTGWAIQKLNGRDFMMPWNISPEFWKLYDGPEAERPLYPFNAEPIEEFVKKYKGARDVPIFSSRFVVPVIYINNLPEYLKEGSPFLRYLRDTKVPFAVLINYGNASLTPEEGRVAWKILDGELKSQFLGWISGESVGHVWSAAATDVKISSSMSRAELLEAHRVFYTNAIGRKWWDTFHAESDPMWDKLIPAQSTSSTSFAHALTAWGVDLLGVETAAVQPMVGMRIAFTRGAARQYGGRFLYYHAPTFGDTATTFTSAQNFAGPNNFYHSRYGVTMGPSLSWYRKSYYLFYMAGASAIYLEQGHDQFFKPGPGEHDFQLNPLGRITTEFMQFAEKHPNRGTPYTPIAFLLDPAHGWEMTDYPHWPFGVSPLDRHDRALRELFGVAYFPGLVVEGEPATGDRQAFVNGIFGDIFDVLVAADAQKPAVVVKGPPQPLPTPQKTPTRTGPKSATQSTTSKPPSESDKWQYEGADPDAPVSPVRRVSGESESARHGTRAPVLPLESYRAVVLGGHLALSANWIKQVTDYVKAGGTLVVNPAQVKGLPSELTGIQMSGAVGEAHNARCLAPGEPPSNLSGQIFRYEKVTLTTARAFITTLPGEPLVTVNKVGKGNVIFCALSDLLGEDERITPFAAHMLTHVFADATPVRVRGDVEYLINRNDGGWVITLFNNKGVYKPAQGMAQVDRSAYVTAQISVPTQQIANAVDWISEKPVEVTNQNGESTANISIAPGGVAIVELKLR